MTSATPSPSIVTQKKLQARLADWAIFLSVTAILLDYINLFDLIILWILLLLAIETFFAALGSSGPSAFFMGVITKYDTRWRRLVGAALASAYLGTILVLLDLLSFVPLLAPLVVVIGIGWLISFTHKSGYLPWEYFAGAQPTTHYDGRRTKWYLVAVAVFSALCVIGLLPW